MLSNTVLSPTLKTEVNSCPPPQVTILTHTRCAPGDRQHGAGVPPSGKQPAARPPLPGAGHGTRALLEPGTEHTSSAPQPLHCPPVAASPFPGLIYCRGCFKEATEITWYNSTWTNGMAPGRLVLKPEETRTTAVPTIRHFPRSQQCVLGQISAPSKNKHNNHLMIHSKPPQRSSRTLQKEKA